MINYKKLIKISNSTNVGLKNVFTHKSILKNRKCGDQIHLKLLLKIIFLKILDLSPIVYIMSSFSQY